MKRSLILVLILFTLTSFSFAEKAIQENNDFKYQETKLKKKTRVESYILVQEFLLYANTLDLTDSQRQELDSVKEDYLYPMIQNEVDFQISEMRVSDMLKAPNFDPEKIKKAIEISIKLTRENAIMTVDALDAIRKAVGIDNFNKVREMMNLTTGGILESDDNEKQDSSHGQNEAL